MPRQRAPIQLWLRNHRLQMPAAILADTFRPLGFLAGEYLAAFAPLLPLDRQRLLQLADPTAVDHLLDDVTKVGDDHV